MKGLKFRWEQIKRPLKDLVDHTKDHETNSVLIASGLIAGNYRFK